MPILSDEEIRHAVVVAAEHANHSALPTYMVLAREIERMTAERVNPRIVVLRKRWLPVRLLGHYRNYRQFQSRRDALAMAWRTATA